MIYADAGYAWGVCSVDLQFTLHVHVCTCTCTVAAKITVTFRSVPPRPDGVTPFILTIPFPFHMHTRTISNDGHGLATCKNGSQLVRSLTRIDSFILPPSSKVF